MEGLVMWTDEEYFSEAVIIGYCEQCGEPIYRGDTIYTDEYQDTKFCDNECVFAYYRIKQMEV